MRLHRPGRPTRRCDRSPTRLSHAHPAPQVSDAILDACLEQDPDSKVRAGDPMRRGPVGPCAVLLPPPPCTLQHRRPPSLPPQVACETASKTGMVMVFGEITTKAKVDYEAIVRRTCKEIGFISDDVGLDCETCKVGVHRAQEGSPPQTHTRTVTYTHAREPAAGDSGAGGASQAPS